MKSAILLVLIFINTSLVMAVPETNKVMRLLEGRHWELREGPFKRLGEGANQRLRDEREAADGRLTLPRLRR